MKTVQIQVVLWLVVAALLCSAQPARAGSCHAHAHAHDTCGNWTWWATASGGSVSCNASANSPGVHSHAWASASCFLFFCNKVGGGHAWWTDGCSPKHYWWHWNVGTGSFVVVSDEPTAEMELLIPVTAPETSLPPASGERPAEHGIAKQGMVAMDDRVVSMEVDAGIGTADGKVIALLRGNATLGGPKSSAPGLRAEGALERILGKVSMGDAARAGVSSAHVAEDFVSKRVTVPTNEPLEFKFDIDVKVGGDDPEEGKVSDSSPPEGKRLSTAASLGATLRLVDQSGRFVLKSLDQEESSTRGSRGGPPIGGGPSEQ